MTTHYLSPLSDLLFCSTLASCELSSILLLINNRVRSKFSSADSFGQECTQGRASPDVNKDCRILMPAEEITKDEEFQAEDKVGSPHGTIETCHPLLVGRDILSEYSQNTRHQGTKYCSRDGDL